ncbi:BTAD domain-containing putative transcriptional regulator [Plantactinospora sp. GCM10030261]|uniref:AfsR/SARP family transcriptional regulator n=1 Tax=Plantactinospora sp. GCM10030261 TaxID=3273420 RepID=UPI00361BA174
MTNGGVEIGVLGPLDVRVAGRRVPVTSPKHRILLAALALEHGRMVSVGRLAEAIWDVRTPVRPRRAVQVYVTRLRSLFVGAGGASVIVTELDGYSVDVPADRTDVCRFQHWLGEADRAARRGDVGGEAAALRRALAQWRGDALADVPSDLLHRDRAPVLHELRLAALDRRIEADLRLGRHRDVVGELTELTGRDPLRERFWLHLMTALHLGGRRVEALAAYHRGRRHLVDELGLEPGADLQRMHARVLTGGRAAGAG